MSASFGGLVVRIFFVCAALPFIPSLACAQEQDRSAQTSLISTAIVRDGVSFLTTVPADGAGAVAATMQAAPPPLPPPLPEEHHPIALGVKGGLMFASLGNVDPFNNPISHSLGATVGVFVGSGGPGRFGIVAEAMFSRRSAEQTDNPANKLNLYSLEIPMLLRINLGSPGTNGVRIYFVAGPAFDVLLKSQLAGQDISENYQGFNVNAIGGGGVEFARFLVEVRGDWGLRSMTSGNFATQASIYTKTVVGLVGFRFK